MTVDVYVPAEDLTTAWRPPSAVCFRVPRIEDGRDIWKLVVESGALDENSPYCYLLLCRDFFETCLVARVGEELAAFVAAYKPPARPDTLFVWQIGVAGPFRKRGLGSQLLDRLIRLPACQACSTLEATVTPSNQASRWMFERFASRHQATCTVQTGFTSALFGGSAHQEEHLLRISPLPQRSAPQPSGGPQPNRQPNPTPNPQVD